MSESIDRGTLNYWTARFGSEMACKMAIEGWTAEQIERAWHRKLEDDNFALRAERDRLQSLLDTIASLNQGNLPGVVD